MSNYINFIESATSKLSSIDIFNPYISNEERIKYRMIQDDITSELKFLIETDDDFVLDMYYSYFSTKVFMSQKLDWSLVNSSFSDLSLIKKNSRLYKLYLEAEEKFHVSLENKKVSLIEVLKIKRAKRLKNRRRR